MCSCLLCLAENQLRTYESLLFCVSNKQKKKSMNTINEKEDEALFEITTKGHWKMSQKELLLISKLWKSLTKYLLFNNH